MAEIFGGGKMRQVWWSDLSETKDGRILSLKIFPLMGNIGWVTFLQYFAGMEAIHRSYNYTERSLAFFKGRVACLMRLNKT